MQNRRMILAAWLNSSGWLDNSWNEGDGNRARIFDIEHYIKGAETARRGCFDCFFLADQPHITVGPSERPEYPFDPLVLATAITARVPDIGAIVTMSTSLSLPYTLARQVASANLLSGGRIGWNAVTTANPNAAANYGIERADHSERYERAEEFLEVVHKLWRSFKFPWDQATGFNPDPHGELGPINHEGKHFKVRGPLGVPLPPYGVPVVAQAGGSEQGKRLAGLYGEIIYAVPGSKPAGQRFVREVRAAAQAAGRSGSAPPRVIASFQPLIGSTEAEVRRLIKDHEATLAPEDERIRTLAGQLGLDLDALDQDRPLTAEDFNLPKESALPLGVLKSMVETALFEKLSVRGLARRLQLIAGTPEQIADRMIDWWKDEAVDGFTIGCPVLPNGLEHFVDTVIPILQREEVFPKDYKENNLRERIK